WSSGLQFFRIDPKAAQLLSHSVGALAFLFGALSFLFGTLSFLFGTLSFLFGTLSFLSHALKDFCVSLKHCAVGLLQFQSFSSRPEAHLQSRALKTGHVGHWFERATAPQPGQELLLLRIIEVVLLDAI